MKITYEDHMGSDLKTVNMARVSFKKRSDWELTEIETDNQFDPITYDKSLNTKDQALINYLAKHKHWAPFAHNVLTVHVKAPIFVARQLFKHKIAFIESEVSRRYINDEPEIYTIPVFRGRPQHKKQGSGEDLLSNERMQEAYEHSLKLSLSTYEWLVKNGVAPEQARTVLPQNTYTEWYLTGSLPAFHRMYNLRTQEDAQKETQDIVKQLDDIIKPLYPLSWSALKEHA